MPSAPHMTGSRQTLLPPRACLGHVDLGHVHVADGGGAALEHDAVVVQGQCRHLDVGIAHARLCIRGWGVMRVCLEWVVG